MSVEIVTSWKTLFILASAAGKTKVRMIANPSEENKQLHEKAVKAHDDYRDICLMANRMMDFPQL